MNTEESFFLNNIGSYAKDKSRKNTFSQLYRILIFETKLFRKNDMEQNLFIVIFSET